MRHLYLAGDTTFELGVDNGKSAKSSSAGLACSQARQVGNRYARPKPLIHKKVLPSCFERAFDREADDPALTFANAATDVGQLYFSLRRKYRFKLSMV